MQCGFSSTIHGNEITEQDQWAKLRLVVEVADAGDLDALLDAGADPNARVESHIWYAAYNAGRVLSELTGHRVDPDRRSRRGNFRYWRSWWRRHRSSWSAH